MSIPCKNRNELLRLMKITNDVLPAYSWPGGYPLYYITAENEGLCHHCANGNEVVRIVGCDEHLEGEDLTCDQCQSQIESAYGILENS